MALSASTRFVPAIAEPVSQFEVSRDELRERSKAVLDTLGGVIQPGDVWLGI